MRISQGPQALTNIANRFRYRVRELLRLGPHHPVVLNANHADESTLDKRCLLVYLPKAFSIRDDDPAFFRHANLRRCRAMAAVLGELGYVVDVANPRHISFRPRHAYDLVISERLNWGTTERCFRADAVRVFLATALDHVVNNRNLRRRHARLVERGRPAVSLRRIFREHAPAVSASDALTGVGNSFTTGTWRRGFEGPILPFNNFGLMRGVLPDDQHKDFETARRSFYFFASGSQMQKGLDLLLEVFARHPALTLYVSSRFDAEPDFCASYHKELFESPNIHPLGWTSVDTPKFLDVLRRSAFVILPSCSEGQAGSVVHCMHSGLIPLVTREAGIDTDDFGVTFADDSIEEIERVVLEAAGRSPEWCREQSERTRRAARSSFTEDAFRARWHSILDEILPG